MGTIAGGGNLVPSTTCPSDDGFGEAWSIRTTSKHGVLCCKNHQDEAEPDYPIVTGPVCEEHPATLICPAGTLIEVVSAVYGRSEAEPCNPTANAGFDLTCGNAATSTAVVQGLCDGLQVCTFAVNNAAFGDDCVGTRKYLVVDFNCV